VDWSDYKEDKNMRTYKTLVHPDTFQQVKAYHKALQVGQVDAGAYLKSHLAGVDLAQLSPVEFLELLVNTKRPQIFAESTVSGNGSDWSRLELTLLGDISIAVPVVIYDDGRHAHPQIHQPPFDGTLIYVPGALLRNGRGQTPADWEEVTLNGQINPDAYYNLYERRLLPVFLYAESLAALKGHQALITMPGLGCGQFAGKFRGRLGAQLLDTLQRFLKSYHQNFSHIQAVYYDPYRECSHQHDKIGHLSLLVQPLAQGDNGRPQLCHPADYAGVGDDFSDCHLFSLVAWDHVSWPGNDFYLGSRMTDDGVKASATNSMAVMTGVEGSYNPRSFTYDPPRDYRNWEQVVRKNHLQIQVVDNLLVLPPQPRK
jgi:hypothetical protein